MSEANTPGIKRCKQCMSEIHSEAIRCPNCGAYQNYRRWLNSINSSVALVLAIIAMLTFFLPIWEDYLKSKAPKLEFSIGETTPSTREELSLPAFISNSSKNKTFINGIVIKGSNKSGTQGIYFAFENVEREVQGESYDLYDFKTNPTYTSIKNSKGFATVIGVAGSETGPTPFFFSKHRFVRIPKEWFDAQKSHVSYYDELFIYANQRAANESSIKNVLESWFSEFEWSATLYYQNYNGVESTSIKNSSIDEAAFKLLLRQVFFASEFHEDLKNRFDGGEWAWAERFLLD